MVSWSSDSLARQLGPPRALVRVSGSKTQSITSGVVDSSGVVTLLVPAPQGSYNITVQYIGAQRLDTTIDLRAGYTDTVKIFLQESGLQICS